MTIKKILVANRGEIAIRIFRACTELHITTIGVYTYEDRYSLHRYKADESYQIGDDSSPLKPYLDIDTIVAVAKEKGADAIHPGYGFLSENKELAEKCKANGIIFIGPEPEVLAALGDKIIAKKVALENHIPIIQSNIDPLDNIDVAISEADRVGYPLMLKAASGGGGRGMRVIRTEVELRKAYPESRREALNAFGDDTVFLEKYVENPKHIEVQIVADNHGHIVHLHERDCSVQRRYQKVIEMAPSFGVAPEVLEKLYDYAIKITSAVNYNNVGTVEFLLDEDGSIYFIEVNPRIQVEHTVTEMVTGIDLIKTQIFIAAGYKLSDPEIGIKDQSAVTVRNYAVQCRITTEDPVNDFKPDYGTVIAYRSAGGFGVRLDAGSIFSGAKISPFFDSMLVKVSTESHSIQDASSKMLRALSEFRIRGVKTNIPFLRNILSHSTFIDGKATVNFIKNEKSLFNFKLPRDRATKVANYIADLNVNGYGGTLKLDPSKKFDRPHIPAYDKYENYPKGTKDKLTELGPDQFCAWLKAEKKIHFTDTTMRDAHQSLLATRMRTRDMLKVAEGYAKNHPNIFSMEVWGGATFDVCMRFLQEDPWERLAQLRKAMPNILLQMLLRGSNAVGYTAYPDNLIQKFVEKSWEGGVDIFRIFDSQNWLESIVPCIDHVRKYTGGLAEACICYTGDIMEPGRKKYTLEYYVQLAKDLENAGAHILAIKDMAGLLKPYAATELISALKSEINIPIHLHTHDTSSIQSATYLKAIEAGVDVVDVALDGMSGLTSQPSFNSMVEMLRHTDREHSFDIQSLNNYSKYWDAVRTYYYPFESGLKSGTSEVYQHEIPGGQYSNLKPQAVGLGLGDRFHEITHMYGQVNNLFGDLIKVTPSSKVVGDMAQFLVSNNLSIDDVLSKGGDLSFPKSVIDFFKGDLGQPVEPFPEKLQKIILKNVKPYTNRPNAHLDPIDFENELIAFKAEFQSLSNRILNINDFLSYKLYPKVWMEFERKRNEYGDLSKVPTLAFFYGMKSGEEVLFDIDKGKTMIIKYLSVGAAKENGYRTVFFQINGQSRNVEVLDQSIKITTHENKKADLNDKKQMGAPLQGLLSTLCVKNGDKVKKNSPLFIIEAMKMETTITAPKDLKISYIELAENTMVKADDLVLIIE